VPSWTSQTPAVHESDTAWPLDAPYFEEEELADLDISPPRKSAASQVLNVYAMVNPKSVLSDQIVASGPPMTIATTSRMRNRAEAFFIVLLR